ncbi:MAG: sigma-70 factor domain-containing protein [Rubrobacteraceae bacterium]
MSTQTYKTVPEETPDLLGAYMARIRQGEVLSHEEEILLSRRAQRGDDRSRRG